MFNIDRPRFQKGQETDCSYTFQLELQALL